MPTSIGELYKTNMPDLTQIADIQEALRIYHYGVPTGVNERGVSYNPNNTTIDAIEPFSIAGHFRDLRESIDNFAAGVTSNAWADKGDLISSSAPGEVETFKIGQPGQVLTVNPFTLTGLEWQDPSVTASNSVSLENKTLILPSITSSGMRFLGSTGNSFAISLGAVEPTANRTIFLPNISTTLVGNNSADIFTNKTVSLTTNTVLGTVEEFNTALTNADFLTTLNAVTIAQGGTGGTTTLTAKSNLDIFRNTAGTSVGSKIYIADPATVGANGSGLVGAVIGDLWFW
jgi:hypothetical protein